MTFPVPRHDHGACIETALAAAETACRARGVRLTDIRRLVLEQVWRGHRPVGAYAILDDLARAGRRAAPPTVYRALDFLVANGLVHRIERFNAFIGCSHPDRPHRGQFLLCAGCGAAAEMDDPAIDNAVVDGATRFGFIVTGQIVEVEGLCPACHAAVDP